MTVTKFDVVGIGNAIVDVLSHSDDGFLEKYNLTKGSMTIIDGETAEKLYSFMESSLEVSGGSVANTMACIASAGG
jgi:sugar/nucleoside kinase (ribokinase family)